MMSEADGTESKHTDDYMQMILPIGIPCLLSFFCAFILCFCFCRLLETEFKKHVSRL